MNNGGENNKTNKKRTITGEFSTIDFNKRRRLEEIRVNEELEREKIKRALIEKRREERLRQKRLEVLKARAIALVVLLGVIAITVGVITAVVKSVSKKKNTEKKPDNAVPEAETMLVTDFSDFSGTLYLGTTAENAFADKINRLVFEKTDAENLTLPDKINEYGEFSDIISAYYGTEKYNEFRNLVKNAPIFSNGYVWTENANIRSSLTGGYMYDNNASYIIAVSNLCVNESDTSLLYETDEDTQPKLDKSMGKTVQEKLNLAVEHYFDSKVTEGGIKYDPISNLVYVLTAENNGTSSGYPSNKWYNFRFGYLDAYNNICFNKAMRALSRLYNLMGMPEQAQEYEDVANKNAEAFNSKFWDPEKQRYTGCFDINGNAYDYGFVFLNLEAIDAQVADDEKVKAIFEWLDGERIIETDTSTGEDIYHYVFAPRNTTVPAEDSWWDYLGGKLPLSTEGGYDKYFQNGGVSLYTEYYDIMARSASGNAKLADRISALSDFADNKYNGYVYDTATSDTDGALSALAFTSFNKTLFGIKTDGIRLYASPDRKLAGELVNEDKSEYDGILGVKNVPYAKNIYGFLFDKDKCVVTAEKRKAVRLALGGFEADTGYEIKTVSSGMETKFSDMLSDENGVLNISADFGDGSYLKIEKNNGK